MRRLAKMGNYGVTYGLSAFGLAQNAGISRAEATRFIEEYNRTYTGVAAYMEQLERGGSTPWLCVDLVGSPPLHS